MTDETKFEETTTEVSTEEGEGGEKKGKRRQGGNARGGKKPQQAAAAGPVSEFEERVVAVNRVAKVVKGGRRFSFSALMIVGDKKGRVGYGLGKAKEVPEAIRKATQAAQKSMIAVPLDGGTIPHQVLGCFDAGKILFLPAAQGTGVKAAGACRSILELAGVKDVLTKSLRGNNPHNVVKATFVALKQLRSLDKIAAARGRDIKGMRLK
jgi:small subunit ribosomal protein S5